MEDLKLDDVYIDAVFIKFMEDLKLDDVYIDAVKETPFRHLWISQLT